MIKSKLVWLVLLIFGSQAIFAEESITISGIKNETLHIISSKILLVAYNKLGYKVEFNFLPSKRSLAWANDGVTNGEVARVAGIEAKYPNLIPVPTPVIYLNGVAFTKNVPDSTKIEKWSDLNDFTVGIVRGYRFSDEGTKDMSPVVAKNVQHLFKILERGRIDIAIINLLGGKLVVAKEFKDKGIHIIGKPLHSAPLFHYVNKDNKDLISKLNKVLIEMVASGEMDKIHNQALNELINKEVK